MFNRLNNDLYSIQLVMFAWIQFIFKNHPSVKELQSHSTMSYLSPLKHATTHHDSRAKQTLIK